MLRKIERIVSIGKFRNYQAAGDVSFGKLTLIYADNGSGKTTLTSILRSLTEGKPEMIVKRLSTNSTNAQVAQIIQRNAAGTDVHHTWRLTGWSNPFPDIEIFDIHFVNDNIYSGFDFTEDHKRQLHHFIVGAQGVAIKKQIEQNKADKAVLTLSIETNWQGIIQKVGNGLRAEDYATFFRLHNDPHIDSKIEAATTELRNAKASVVIQQLQELLRLNSITSQINFEEIIADLAATTETIKNDALQLLFAGHCDDLAENGIENPNLWLQEGYIYLQTKNGSESGDPVACPFCKQSINDDLDIISSYALRFNQAFNELVGRIENHIQSVERFNMEATCQGLNTSNDTNAGRITGWTAHLPATITPPVFAIIADEETFRNELSNLLSDLREKLSNPSVAINTANAAAFRDALVVINRNITDYNLSVNGYNDAIRLFKRGIKTEAVAQAELNSLMRIKKKFEADIQVALTQNNADRVSLKTLQDSYTTLSRQEHTEATTFFTNYSTRINYYLRDVFRTPFLIDQVAHIAPQGRSTTSKISYRLTIDGQAISFDVNAPNAVKECLSEGDKSTLAFAFFLAKLDIDPNIADKIIVFDDPLSSFDSNRRLYTVDQIHLLYSKVKQIVVLSHNEFFLFDILKGAERNSRKTLSISVDFIDNTAKITPLELEKMVEKEYFKHIKELETFLRNADLTQKDRVLGLIRNILEANIQFKFHRQLPVVP